MRKIWVVLILILILAGFLRLWQLGNVPASLDWDEVALGYNAYSIIETGKDEFGKFLPVVLRSFDDYKPALYTYLIIPFYFIFGLSDVAVRIPSAIMGVISVLAVFLLIREVFEKYKHKDFLSIASAFFIAISPWSIQFSRVAFESQTGAVLNILAALFFVKGLKNPKLLLFSSVFAGLSIYVYQSEKVFTPLLMLCLILIYRKDLLALSRKYLVLFVAVGLIVVAPMFFYITTNRAALLRVTGTSIFSYQTELLKNSIQKLERDNLNNDKIGKVFDNRRITYFITIVSGYIVHFDPNWLFIRGDISRHHAPGMGLLYLFEFPLILMGIYFLLFGNFSIKTKLLIFSWLLLAPVPASITTGVPHAVRTLNFIPSFHIFTAIGLLSLYLYIAKFRFKYVFYLLFIMIFGFNFTYYLNQYFVQQNYYYSQDWQYGYKEAVAEVVRLQDKYENIIISDNQPLDKSYMFFLFYLKYPPKEYQKIGESSSGSFDSHHKFGRYNFRSINWEKDSSLKNTLLIGTPKEIPDGAPILKTIYNKDGSVAIIIAGT